MKAINKAPNKQKLLSGDSALFFPQSPLLQPQIKVTIVTIVRCPYGKKTQCHMEPGRVQLGGGRSLKLAVGDGIHVGGVLAPE